MTEPYDSCPVCKTRHPKGWACPAELRATAMRLDEKLDEIATLRRQLEEANDDIDTYKGDLNEAAHGLDIELLQVGLRGKLAGLVLAMNGQLTALQADNEGLREAAIRVSCLIEAEEPEADSRMADWANRLRAALAQPEKP